MTNYKQVEVALRNTASFTHGRSMFALWVPVTIVVGEGTPSPEVLEGHEYRVYSYQTLIAKYSHDVGSWWTDETKYSSTTSRQQNIVKRASDHNIIAGTVWHARQVEGLREAKALKRAEYIKHEEAIAKQIANIQRAMSSAFGKAVLEASNNV